jgi:hypothetical protein
MGEDFRFGEAARHNGFKAPKKDKPIFRRTLSQRLEIMKREIDAMTDEEQIQLLRILPQAMPGMFRLQNLIKVANERSGPEAGVSGHS